MKCEYGCGEEAIKQFKNGKYCCSERWERCPQQRELSRIKNLGSNNPMFGKGYLISGESHPLFGKGYLISGENNPNWKEGNYDYWHDQAWKLFGKDRCDLCGKYNEDHIKETGQRLCMHCISIPKNYTLMEQSNWTTICCSCHRVKLDSGNKT